MRARAVVGRAWAPTINSMPTGRTSDYFGVSLNGEKATGGRNRLLCIVGAGSAGCVLANRLSASGADVLVLEAGGPDENPAIKIPALYLTPDADAVAKRSVVPSSPALPALARPGASVGRVLAAPYSITSSARARRVGGIVRPRALAVFRLMTSSNFVGCSTGRSAGLAPFRILSTKAAARRQ